MNDKPNGSQRPITVHDLYAMIGQLTVENQSLRIQLQQQQATQTAATKTETKKAMAAKFMGE
jgi:hypothetical protein